MPLRPRVEFSERRIPFVIAVTGHRDLRSADVDQLKDGVRSILTELADSIPSTPLLVLTGLAEGADQLVAQVALEIGIEIAAVIPMPMDLYSEQMSDAGQRELHDLYEKATLKINLPISCVTEAEVRSSESLRAECYQKLASFIASHSQALIALWDGKDSELKGGTAEVVSRMLKRFEASMGSEEGVTTKAVYHLVTPRVNDEEIPNAFKVQLWPKDQYASNSGGEHEAVREDLNRFNHAVAKEAGADSAVQVAEDLLGERHEPPSTFLNRVAVTHSLADCISLRFSKRRSAFLILIIVLALTGIFGLELHSDLLPNLDYLWLIFPVSVGAAAGLYLLARMLRIEGQFLDARSLAEALRVQFFWWLSGLEEPVSKYYLRHHQGSMGWIRTALLNLSLFQAEDARRPLDKEGMHSTLVRWVQSQAKWYKAKAERQSKTLAHMERVANRSLCGVVMLSFVIGVSLVLPGPWHSAWQLRVHEHLNGFFHLLIAIPSITLGAFKIWVEQAGYDEQVRNYKHMADVFSHSAHELEEHLDAGRLSEAREVIRELGIQALQENSSWMIMHREHPLKVVGP